MKFIILLVFILCQNIVFSQNNHSIYFDINNTTINQQESNNLISYLKTFDSSKIYSFVIYVYHDDTGNDIINSQLSKKRAEELVNLLTKNGYKQQTEIIYKGYIKDSLTNNTLKENIQDQNRRIDIVVNQDNKSTSSEPKATQKNISKSNLYSIYYSGEDTIVNQQDIKNLGQFVNNIDVTEVKSVVLNVYNAEAVNKTKNKQTSKERADRVKNIISKNNPNIKILIVYIDDIKTPIKTGMSDTHIEFLKNKNRRIDVIANYSTITPSKAKTSETIVQAPTKQHNFSEKQNTFSIYYDSENSSTPNKLELDNLLNALLNIDTSKVKLITLKVYNDDSGNKTKDYQVSKKRAEELKKIMSKNSKVALNIDYQDTRKTEIKEVYSPKHIEYLKNKNRRIDVLAVYPNTGKQLDINSLGIGFAFSGQSRTGDRIMLRNGVFDNDRSRITSDIAKDLDIIAMQLKKYTHLQIEVQGHVCCTKGGYEAVDKDTGKLELSSNRAKATYQYLVKKSIDPKRLRFKGYGNQNSLGKDDELNKKILLQVYRS